MRNFLGMDPERMDRSEGNPAPTLGTCEEGKWDLLGRQGHRADRTDQKKKRERWRKFRFDV